MEGMQVSLFGFPGSRTAMLSKCKERCMCKTVFFVQHTGTHGHTQHNLAAVACHPAAVANRPVSAGFLPFLRRILGNKRMLDDEREVNMVYTKDGSWEWLS
jgi:hypothetical protein